MDTGTTNPRPWERLRYWLLAGGLLIAGAIVLVVLETRSVQLSEPNISTDYRAEYRQYLQQHIDLGPNDGADAWQELTDALQRMDQILADYESTLIADFQPRYEYDDPSPWFDYVLHGPQIPADADRERDAIELLRQRGVLDQIARFVDLAPAYSAVQDDELRYLSASQHVSQMRTFTKMRCASMRVAFTNGDLPEVVRSVEQILAVAQSNALQPGLISSMMSIGNRLLAFEELRFQLMESQFDAATCRLLLQALDCCQLPGSTVILEGERAVAHDGIQHWFSDDGRGNGYMLEELSGLQDFSPNPQQISFASAFQSRYLLPDRRAFAAMFDHALDAVIAEANKPIGQRWVEFDPERFAADLSEAYEWIALSLPAIKHVMNIRSVDACEHKATKIMLALSLHRAVHGTYPASLNELVPDILPQLPVDPLHGGTFGYHRLDDDEHGRPYLLYSFGMDGTDNDGALPSEDISRMALIDRETSSQYDYVFTLPRPEWDLATPEWHLD